MPNNASITIKDGASTPTDRILLPKGASGASSTAYVFRENKAGVIMDGQLYASIEKRPQRSSQTTNKDTFKVVLPKVVSQEVGGVTRQIVDHNDLIEISVSTSRSSTTQERKDLRVLAANLLLSGFAASVVDDQETIW